MEHKERVVFQMMCLCPTMKQAKKAQKKLYNLSICLGESEPVTKVCI